MTEQKEEPRLYTRQPRGPVDQVAPQHVAIHAELEAWGRWSRDKYQQGTCDSVEKRFDPGEGGRKVRPPSMPALPENPQYRQLDRVVRHMRMWLNQHGEAVVLYYVGQLYRGRNVPCEPRIICRMLHIHWTMFGPLMFDSRAAVINLLRRGA